MLLLDDGLHLFLDDDPHGFVEDVFEAILSQGTALHILALELFLDDFAGSFSHYGCLFGVFLVDCVLLPQIDFVPHKYLRHISHVFLELGVPLS